MMVAPCTSSCDDLLNPPTEASTTRRVSSWLSHDLLLQVPPQALGGTRSGLRQTVVMGDQFRVRPL